MEIVELDPSIKEEVIVSGASQDRVGRESVILGEHPYWEDPVFRYLSRKHRLVVAEEDGPEADRVSRLLDGFVAGRIEEGIYKALEVEAKEDRKEQRRRRKGKSRPPLYSKKEDLDSSVNIADLKRRIFNPHVSRENVIKAIEALPPKERKATIASFPPGLRRRLEGYLKGRN